MSVRWLVRLSGLLLLAVAGSAALAPAVAQKIRPARAIYDLSLGKKGAGVELESLTGRLALELIETCEGAIFNQGFVTRSVQTTGEELFGDVQASLWERRDGRRFRFTQLSRSSGQEDEESRGGAELFPDGGGIARWSLPKPAEITLPRGTLFSVGYSKRVLEMAATGSRGFEVPLFDGMFAAIGSRGHRVHEAPVPDMRGMLSWSTQFQCEDGQWVYFMTGNTRTRDVAAAAGVSDWYERGMFDRERLAADDELAAEQAKRAPELFQSRTAQEWEDLVASAEGECAVCNTTEEWLSHPHALGSEIIIESEHPDLGSIRQPGLNVRLSESPGSIRWAAPQLDEHRDDVLGELDRLPPPPAPASIDATMRAALEGVKVLDLCIILAGPTCGRTLAEFGADVIKIDNPNRGTIAFHNDVNRGKRSMLLDLKTEEGVATFWDLVDEVDVVVQNYRKGAVDKLGIGYEDVRKRRPDIVYASLNAYGHVGPWAGRPGHEQLGQAVTGMQRRYGGDGRPTLQPFAVNDYGTGFMGAYGVALALLHRNRTGQGQHVDSSLAYTATMLQSPFMLDYEGKQWDEPSGQDAVGSGPLHCAYEASDGWLFIGAQDRDLPRLDAVEGMSGVEGLSGDALEGTLAARLAGEPVETWVGRFAAADIGVSPVLMDARQLMEDPWVVDRGLSVTREHDGVGLVTTTGPGPRLSRSPLRPGNPASAPGADARDVLAEFDLADRYDGLVERGVLVVDGVTGR